MYIFEIKHNHSFNNCLVLANSEDDAWLVLQKQEWYNNPQINIDFYKKISKEEYQLLDDLDAISQVLYNDIALFKDFNMEFDVF